LPKLPDNNLPRIKDEEVIKVLYQAKVTASSGSTVNMRKSPSKTADKLIAIPIGETVDVLEEGTEWNRIAYNNQIGYMMKEFLKKIESIAKDEPTAYYVKIKCNSEEEAKKIAQILGTATVGK